MITRQYVSFDWAMKRLLRSKTNFAVLAGLLSELLKELMNFVISCYFRLKNIER
jgi:hypothetical protein